ncbi:MAG TPA: hypothetical protein VKR78_04575, partial [Acidimicrobiales bacterium]|nr:hypothetical protein [Acidimicrobiales bacterium]
VVVARSSGFLRALDARRVGVAAWHLGAGRGKKEDPVSPSAGVICLRKPGEEVAHGDAVLELRADDPALLDPVAESLEGAAVIGPEPADAKQIVLEVIRQ